MRDFLNSILSFIGSESLSDLEFETIDLTIENYSKTTYLALKSVIESRESVSDQGKRLKLYFISHGTDISESESEKTSTPNSNIFIGVAL